VLELLHQFPQLQEAQNSSNQVGHELAMSLPLSMGSLDPIAALANWLDLCIFFPLHVNTLVQYRE
jgi:hypothetical protein